jgi:HD-GYP domain-containing protein (c-di-GMP phosphodiesterase class II)
LHVAHHPVDIEVGDRALVVQSAPLPAEDRQAAQLRAYLAARRVHRLTIGPEAAEEAVATLIRLLALEPEELIAEGGLADALRSAGAPGITVESVEGQTQRPSSVGDDPYEMAVSVVFEITASVEQGGPADVPRTRLAVERLIATLSVARQRLWQDVADRSHDELDPQHAVNTCLLTLFVAEALGLTRQPLTDVGTAALLHDIGLAALPSDQRVQERTINGPHAQWRHPAEGAYVLRHLGGHESLPMIVAAEHHLPALKDPSVLPQARLVGLADYADALTCGRVPAMRRASVGTLLSELLAGGGPAFDPVHVRVLARLLADAAGAGIEFTSAV